MRRDLAKGDLPALILAVLSNGARHGYGIAREVKQLSDQILRLHEGSLYPALRVLEQDGLIVGRWEPQEKGTDRKVYELTEAGKKEMTMRTKELKAYVSLITTMLGRTGHVDPA